MTVLLQWHKGHNKNVVPTWFPLVEEDIPALCPVTYILTKAIAEGVVANKGYQKELSLLQPQTQPQSRLHRVETGMDAEARLSQHNQRSRRKIRFCSNHPHFS